MKRLVFKSKILERLNGRARDAWTNRVQIGQRGVHVVYAAALIVCFALFGVILTAFEMWMGIFRKMATWQSPAFVPQPRHLDYLRFYSVGQLAVSPNHRQFYDPNAQLAALNAVIAPEHMRHPFFLSTYRT